MYTCTGFDANLHRFASPLAVVPWTVASRLTKLHPLASCQQDINTAAIRFISTSLRSVQLPFRSRKPHRSRKETCFPTNSGMASELSPEEQREVIARYQRLREEADQLYIKLSQVDSDRNEHELVLKQLTGLESDRRCWHQIGAVLAEKKVGEILPILTMNRDQFANVVKNLNAAVQQKDKQIAELQTKYGITEVRK